VLVPEAIPLALAGTEFITDALFGTGRGLSRADEQEGTASCQNVTVLPIVASIRKPIIDMTSRKSRRTSVRVCPRDSR